MLKVLSLCFLLCVIFGCNKSESDIKEQNPIKTPSVPSNAPSSGSGSESRAIEVESLHALANFPIGAAVETYTRGGSEAFAHDLVRTMGEEGEKRRDIVRKHFNSLSPANAFKMKSLQPEYRTFFFGDCQLVFTPKSEGRAIDTGDADCMLDFAEDNGFNDVHLHTLLWYRQSPNWLRGPTSNLQKALAATNPGFKDNVGRDEYLAEMFHHIDAVVCEYADRVTSIDVVNEAFSDWGYHDGDNADGLRRFDLDNSSDDATKLLDWNERVGSDYIELAFRRAKAKLEDVNCRKTKHSVDLYLNDYQLVVNEAKREVALDYIKDFLDSSRNAGPVPIDGIGIQMHYNTSFNNTFSPENVREGLRELVATGLKIRILEMDVQGDLDNDGALNEEEANKQGQTYKDLIAVYMEEVPPSQRGGITFWGVSDRYSWLADTHPLMFDEELNPKPALRGVAEALRAKQAQN